MRYADMDFQAYEKTYANFSPGWEFVRKAIRRNDDRGFMGVRDLLRDVPDEHQCKTILAAHALVEEDAARIVYHVIGANGERVGGEYETPPDVPPEVVSVGRDIISILKW